ncbi:nitrous oxide reductase family maturation protein NosD [Desulfosporosinus sp. PR]|uniref:nitrous oxide reductase family maturation protein NosD n=1 Tax=Candidatus Desulfosporosinus nitrosoreducens TaxID=3401928 RepID=UPI0027EA6DC6|nr:nitrous oxide reductase family maturation protein NosD [Desulfosporosinus sp. PR]MDQ7097055.1 nitrous oxide reductase family maturation protein NosD [Desulfosporosinus sp. PR]
MAGNRKWSACLLLGVFTLLSLGLGKPALAQGAASTQLTVGPQGEYSDIKSAVAAAQPGQTINVEPGVYRERLSINKPLTLRGQAGAILDGGGQETIILITGTQDVTVSGLSLRNSGGPATIPYAGVKVVQSKNVTVDQVKMSDIEHGVYLEQSSHCRVTNNEISGKVNLLPEDRGDAIGLWKSDHNVFSNNHAWNVRDGIKFEFSTFNQVSSNQFDHLRYGLHYMYSNDNTFDHNLFEDDVAGATPMYSKRIQFTDNIFVHMPGERGYAILLQDSDNCVLKNNLIMQSNVGLHFDHSNNNVVEGNTILSCGVAIRVLGTSTENTFAGNKVEDNVVQVSSDYQALPNIWSLQGRGNYWSDYKGYDFTGAGIGALPYNSLNYLAKAVYEQPLLELFADSPGIQALSQGLQMFPLWQLPGIRDQYPLLHPAAPPEEWRPYLSSASAGGNPVWLAALSVAALLAAGAILRKGWRRRKNHA